MELFERALRRKLRFKSSVGLLTTEQLWELPLVAKGDKPSLDAVAREANAELKALGEESFVDPAPNQAKSDAQLRLDIAKYVIAARQDDAKKAEKAAETAAYKKQLLEALANKKSDALKGMSEDQIKAELEKLEA